MDTSRLHWFDVFDLVALPSNEALERTCADQRGSLGARLHRGSDGLWYSYAQWPSAEACSKAFAAGPVDSKASRQMHAAIAEEFPELVLESYADFMVSPYAGT